MPLCAHFWQMVSSFSVINYLRSCLDGISCRKIETNLSRRVKTFKSRPCHPNYPKVDNYQEVAAISPIILELSTDIQHDMAQWNAVVVQGIKSNTNSVMAIIILRSKHVEVAWFFFFIYYILLMCQGPQFYTFSFNFFSPAARQADLGRPKCDK